MFYERGMMFEQTIVVGEMADGTPLTVTVERLFPPVTITKEDA